MAGEVTVVATMKVSAGRGGASRRILRSVIEPSHTEDGCVKYTLHRSSNEPGAFCIVEKWRSQADLDAHFKQPHMAPIAKALELLAEPPLILFCEPVAVGDQVKGSL